MHRLTALCLLLGSASVVAGGSNDPVAYYSPDVTRLVEGSAIFASDAHRENEVGITMPGPAGLPTLLTNLRGVNLDALTRIDGDWVFSLDSAARVGNTFLLPGDVVRCNNADCSLRSIVLDATLDIPRTVNVDAIAFARDSGHLLYSIEADAVIGGSAFLARDVIRWNGSSHILYANGSTLPAGTVLDALDSTLDGFYFSLDVTVSIDVPGGTLLVRNKDVVARNLTTGVASFAPFGPSGDWSGANLDALHIGTVGEGDALFSDGFEGPALRNNGSARGPDLQDRTGG